MLREIKKTRQAEGEPIKRWFFCHDLDVVVWFDAAGTPLAFQLAYGKYFAERSLSWHVDRGYRHYAVDDGEFGTRASSPVLLTDGPFDARAVLKEFTRLSSEMPADLVEFIQAKLLAYPNLAYSS